METKSPSLASFAIIQIFWMTLYSEAIFQVLGGIKTQLALLTAWFVLLVAFPKTGSRPAMRNVARHAYEIFFLAAFMLVNMLSMMFGRGGYDAMVKSVLILITYMTVVIHLQDDFRRYRQAVVTVIVVVGAIAVYDLPQLIMHPFLARLYEFAPGEIQWFGSWGFFMPYAIALPVGIAVARSYAGTTKAIVGVLLVVMALLIVVSTFAASIILMLFGFAGFIAFSIRRPRTYAILGAVAVVIVVAISQFDVSKLPQIAPMVTKITTIFTLDKAADISDPNDPRVRASLIETSLHTFAAHPLVGVGIATAEEGYDVVGNHSGIIDSLAIYGVLGSMWYLLFFGMRFKRVVDAVRFEPSNPIHQGRLLTAAAFAIGSLANPILYDVAASAIVFIFAFSPLGLATTLPQDVSVAADEAR